MLRLQEAHLLPQTWAHGALTGLQHTMMRISGAMPVSGVEHKANSCVDLLHAAAIPVAHLLMQTLTSYLSQAVVWHRQHMGW